MNSNLKNLKYYEASWISKADGWGETIGRYATKKEAERAIKEYKNTDGYWRYDFVIEELNVYDLIQTEKEIATRREYNRLHTEIYNELFKMFQTELSEAIKKERKRLQKEMKNIVKNWFEINPDGKEK